tara:strand:- start:3278 stop:3925 length:648 start_codon:yes stop_codon:yes gene_type:complete
MAQVLGVEIKQQEVFFYLSAQSSKEIRETGRVSYKGWSHTYLLYEDDIDRLRTGIGIEWRLQFSERYKFAPGFMYQDPLHIQQRTTTYGDNVDCSAGGSPGESKHCVSGASRNDLPHISYYSIYLNNYWLTESGIPIFIAPIFIFPDVNSHGRFEQYRVENGRGFQIGVELKIIDQVLVQTLWRSAVIDTRDDGMDYKGDRELNSFQFNLGYNFK